MRALRTLTFAASSGVASAIISVAAVVTIGVVATTTFACLFLFLLLLPLALVWVWVLASMVATAPLLLCGMRINGDASCVYNGHHSVLETMRPRTS